MIRGRLIVACPFLCYYYFVILAHAGMTGRIFMNKNSAINPAIRFGLLIAFLVGLWFIGKIFHIDLDKVEESGLKISARMLASARKVHSRNRPIRN